MFCSKCGSENNEDAQFCAKCGNALIETDNIPKPVYRAREENMCFGSSGGTFPALVIGVIIIIVGTASFFGQSIGTIMGTWGENFGQIMGRWGMNVGRFFAEWGTNWGSRLGASISILIGLLIIYYILNSQGRR